MLVEEILLRHYWYFIKLRNNNLNSDSRLSSPILPGLPMRISASSYYLIIEGDSIEESTPRILLGSAVRDLPESTKVLGHSHLGSAALIHELFSQYDEIESPLAEKLLSLGFRRIFVGGRPTNSIRLRMSSTHIPNYLLDRLFPGLSRAGNTSIIVIVSFSSEPTVTFESLHANAIVILGSTTLLARQILEAISNEF